MKGRLKVNSSSREKRTKKILPLLPVLKTKDTHLCATSFADLISKLCHIRKLSEYVVFKTEKVYTF